MKKLLSILLICALTFCAGGISHAADGSEAMQAANELYGLGLFSGTGVTKDGQPVYSLDRKRSRWC